MDGMRVLPPCSEGFRRLAVVLAIVVGLGLFGFLMNDFGQRATDRYAICGDTYLAQIEAYPDAHSPCHIAAFKNEENCFALTRTGQGDRFETWGLYALASLLFAYAAALIVRTLGWVAQGFQTHE